MTGIVDQENYQLELEMALKNSKETDLNGHIPLGGQAQKIGKADMSDNTKAKSPRDSCEMCGQAPYENACDEMNHFTEESEGKLKCKQCEDDHPAFSPTPEEDGDALSKRDSGFHTLKREESNKADAGNSESALSSASSADSAVSVSCTDCVGSVQESSENRTLIPSIVIDPTAVADEIPSENNTSSFIPPGLSDPQETGFIETPETLADKLYNFKGYKRIEVASHLGKNTEFSRKVGQAYLKHFSFNGVFLIDAYREYLSHFALVGETQERERILLYFSERYLECNPSFLDKNPDSVHTLICALTLLNTDLHSNMGFSGGRKRMTSKQFVSNLSGLMPDKQDFPKELLELLYNSVKKNPLPWGGKERKVVTRSSSTRQNNGEGSSATSKMVIRSLSVRSPVKKSKSPNESLPIGSKGGSSRSAKMKSLSTNQGLLWRKVLHESEGKKVSIGKRGWKVYSVTLKNLELHVAKRGNTEMKCISLHHSWAEESTNDSKRQHVFRLTLADGSVTLYQASSDKENRKWVKDINKAAALLSAAPLCSPVGSQMIFRKPLLPSAPSTLPLSNQHDKMQDLLRDNESELKSLTKDFGHTESPQEEQYCENKKAHLELEILKYQRYVKILQGMLEATADYKDDTPASETTNLELSHGSSENGSLVSMTPSEPPLASPSPFHTNESFHFPDTGDGPSAGYPPGGLSSPAHLVSSQHRNHTLSPTSSLPNLSPILEGSPIHNNFPPADPSYASLQRRRKEANLYESMINDAADEDVAEENSNTNNSNHNSLKFVPPLLAKSAGGSHKKGSQPPRATDKTFPVKRYNMRLTSLEGTNGNSKHALDRHTHMAQSANGSLSNAVLRKNLEHKYYLDQNSAPTGSLPRIRGRKERKGTERLSYMQAVSLPDQ